MKILSLSFLLTAFLPPVAAAGGPLSWTARWIAAPQSSPTDFGVYHFRRTIDFPAAPPARLLVHVTADNRYQLFVNGTRVSQGPARGDLFHWRYETVDLVLQLYIIHPARARRR